MILGLDFAMGVAATLSAEFLIAHAFIWFGSGGSNTVLGVVKAAETDLSRGKSGVVLLEQKAVQEVKTVANAVEAEVKRGEEFFQNWFESNNAVANTPVVVTPAVSTPPQTHSGGTPVPSVVLSAPSK